MFYLIKSLHLLFMKKPQNKSIKGLTGKALIEALSDDKGNITYNCMFELIMGYRSQRPLNRRVSVGHSLNAPQNIRHLESGDF